MNEVYHSFAMSYNVKRGLAIGAGAAAVSAFAAPMLDSVSSAVPTFGLPKSIAVAAVAAVAGDALAQLVLRT
jgi:hypothetical protein